MVADIQMHIHIYTDTHTDSFNSSNTLVDIKDGASSLLRKSLSRKSFTMESTKTFSRNHEEVQTFPLTIQIGF